MTTHLVTFVTPEFFRSRATCISSALQNGVTHTHPFEPYMLPPTMQQYCEGKRGFGHWQWKPMAIQIAMRGCEEGSILIYSDVGVEFIDNVNYIIDRMDQDIFLFGNMYEHAHWCKRDVVEAIWPDRVPQSFPWARFGKQAQASVIFLRVNDHTRAFVKEWLDWCLFEGGRLIDDSPSRTPNHPEFQENRHDQAILTTMAYRDGIRLNWWPAVYNDGQFTYPRGDYPDLGYPVLFHHHRRRDTDWEQERIRVAGSLREVLA